MELRHLRYFVKSAEMLHFTRAAESLHVSQPTLSLQNRQLETEVGTTLFQRIGRRVCLTEAGKLLLEHARRALREVENAQHGIDHLNGLLRGTLRIGVTYCFSAYSFPTIVAMFADMYPSVRIKVTQTTTRAIERGLLNSDLDIGVVFQTSKHPAFTARQLFKGDIIVVVSRNHPLAELKSIRFQDLKDVRLALPSDGFSTRQIVNARFARAGISPNILLETNEINVLLAAVRSGRAAAVVSRQAVAHLIDLCKIPFQEKGIMRSANLIWPVETQLSAVGMRFVEIASNILLPPNISEGVELPSKIPALDEQEKTRTLH